MRALVAPAHVNLDASYGGEASWVYNLTYRLASSFNTPMDIVCGVVKDLVFPSTVRVFDIGFNKGDLINRGLFNFKYYSVARKLYKDADLIHHMLPFGFKSGFNPLAAFGHLREKPFIIGPIQYPQEYVDITDYEWVSGRGFLKVRLMYNLEKIAMRLIQKPIEILHEATLSEAEALIFDSRKTLELYKKLYRDILRGKTLEVIPPGIETGQFRYVDPIKKDHFEILTVGYLLKRKGIQYLIRAMSTIVEEFGNVKLKVVGDGPYKENLIKQAKKLSLDKHIEFSGYVPRCELPTVYANCGVYVQPSLSETFPSAVREAMSVGRPVITTSVGFMEEYIKHGINGFLVQSGDPEALVEAIAKLLADEDLRLKMGLNARIFVKNLSWDKIASDWYKLYTMF